MRDHTILAEALRRHGLRFIPDMHCPCGGRMQATLHVFRSQWEIRCNHCDMISVHSELPTALFMYRKKSEPYQLTL